MKIFTGCVFAVSITIGATVVYAEPASSPVYVECDDGARNATRIVLALDESNNTVGVVEWGDYTVVAVSAVSFGPDKVMFTSERSTGLQEYFSVSRIDASVTKTGSSMFPDSAWHFKGCKVIEAPTSRAF